MSLLKKLSPANRIWVMRIATAVLTPVLFLLLIEGVLRLAGYGYPVNFFLPVAGDKRAVRANPRYTYRFFPRQLVREPDLIRMDRKKPDGTYRIFVLGGSAARGTPEPRLGFGRILQVMLEEAFPGREFEVVNTAMVAVNSHVVLRAARECLAYEPDLLVVYMGNNEVIGPYGANAVFSKHVPGRAMIALASTTRACRTGQALTGIAQWLRRSPSPSEWGGLEMLSGHRVAADDPRLQNVYDNFEGNLKAIASAARARGVPMILSTVPVNLRDFAPMASTHVPTLTDAARDEWERLYREGIALQEAGRLDQADHNYARAAALDAGYAELHFRRARCALGRDDQVAADAHFKTARDLDTLRFRADSEINRIIRTVGTNDSLTLVDAEKRFASLPGVPHAIPGDELFYEHVHLTFKGNYELARVIFEEAVKQVQGGRAGQAPSLQQCAKLLGFSDLDRLNMAKAIMNMVIKPPFTGQMDYHQRCGNIHARIRSLRHHAGNRGIAEARQVLTEALQLRPNDLYLRRALALVQIVQKDGAAAQATLGPLLQKLPERAQLHSYLGQALLIQGHRDEAEEAFEKSIALGSLPLNYMIQASYAYEEAGDTRRAEAFCRRALAEQPEFITAYSRLAEILFNRRDAEQALELLQSAELLQPGNGDVLFDLSRAYFETRDRESAVEKLRATLAVIPFHLGARMHLALILKHDGYFEEAAQYLAEVVEHEPDRQDLRLHLAESRVGLGRFDEAESDYRAVLTASPKNLDAALGLAWLLAVRPEATPQERAEAVAHAERVVKATGKNSAKPLDVLAAALASSGRFKNAEIYATEARLMALAQKDSRFAEEVLGRLNLYRKKQPFRFPARDE